MDSFRKKSNLSTTFEEDWVEMGSSFKISKDDKKNPSNCMTSKSLEVTIRVFASDILGKKRCPPLEQRQGDMNHEILVGR